MPELQNTESSGTRIHYCILENSDGLMYFLLPLRLRNKVTQKSDGMEVLAI